MKKFITLFGLLFSTLTAAQSCDTLFVLQDAGETNALIPVIEQSEQNHDNFAILVGGVAAEIIGKHPTLKHHTITYPQLQIDEKLDKAWKRDQKISEVSLFKIKNAFPAKKIVSGVAFEFQGQLLECSEVPTFAYWDNINFQGTDPYFQTAKKVAILADHLMVPSNSFRVMYPNAAVVGQPTFEAWKADLEQINPKAVRSKLPFSTPSPIIVFVGGYGDEYNQALSQFLDAAENFPTYTILLSVHPKFEGKVEKKELAKRSLPHVHIVDQISSMEAIALADTVVCHQSSVGVQAAFADKSVIYWIPEDQTYTNPLIEQKITPKASNSEDLKIALSSSKPEANLFTLLKVPMNSVFLLYTYIHER
ncbi:MAG TPA: hypothetical protein PKW79_07250 [Rhabdochlamydiaceae bacterium]|nr:hypothetical protein [Rhabdochlamydiaceae bacterium]